MSAAARPALFALLLAGLAAPLSAPARADCLRPTDPVTGTLRLVGAQHPNGTRMEVLQLRLDRPGCMLVEGQPVRFRDAQLVTADAALRQRLRGALGRRATLRAGDASEPQTAWHIGDLVLFEVRLLRLAPP